MKQTIAIIHFNKMNLCNVQLLNIRLTCFSYVLCVRAIQSRLFNVSIIIPVDKAMHIIHADTPNVPFKHMLDRVVNYFLIYFNSVYLLYLLICKHVTYGLLS